MKKILTLVFTIVMVNLYAQVNITFQVNMTGETISADGVHIAGSLNGWNTSANPLTDQGGDVYAVTIALAANTTYEFKYLNGNAWGTEETPPASCTINSNNRFFTTSTNDEVLDIVPFNGCGSTHDVTFQVDMTGQTVSPDGVHVAGNFPLPWNTTAYPLTLQSGNIYAVTIPLAAHTTYEYKYLNGNTWGTEEVPPATCTINGNNRFFTTPANDVVLEVVPFNDCSPTQNITFQVDMTGQTISPDGVHIAGEFNNWNPSATMLTHQGGDIYSVTLGLIPHDDYEYKYLNGNAWGTEETPPAACTVTGFNRISSVSDADAILPVVVFNSCPANPTQDVTFYVDMNGQTVSGDGVHVTGNFNEWNTSSVSMTDMGNGIYTATAPVISTITTVQYKYLNGNIWGTEEDVPLACENSNENREFVIEGQGSSIDFPIYEFGTCNATVVPVELTFFKGNALENSIELTWQTASEEQNKGFEIEKSVDGKHWEMIDFVEGHGTTFDVQNYHFIDKNPVANVNYYRLKQVDFDGGFEYSNIVLVDFETDFNQNSIQVFPNPIQDELNIINAKGQLILYNSIGQPLKELTITDDTFQLNTNDLQTGTYFLRIYKNDGSSFSKTIIK